MTDDRGPGELRAYLEHDHRVIAGLLAFSVHGGAVDRAKFDELRGRLLRHIAIEERVLLVAAREERGGEPIARARQLRVEHAAIASLLVGTPDLALVEELRALLAQHEPLEEGEGGVYEECERIIGERDEELAARARAYPAVPLARASDGERTVRTAWDALTSAARIRFGR